MKSAKNRLIKYSRETGHNIADNQQSAKQLSDYLVRERYSNNYKQPTWRKIRAELKYYFETTEQKTLATMIDHLPRTKIEAQDKKKEPRKNYISLPKKLYKELQQELLNTSGKYGILAYALLESIWLTGIRPKEWISMVMSENFQDSGRHMLRVENAKNTNDRSFDKYRNLIVTATSDEELHCLRHLKLTVNDIKKEAGGDPEKSLEAWKKVLNSVGTTLYNANKKVRPNSKKTISLYSARHQFAADAKASDISQYELAALMGHASIDTAIRYYGRKRTGYPRKFRTRAQLKQTEKLKNERNMRIEKRREKKPDWDLIKQKNQQRLAEKNK